MATHGKSYANIGLVNSLLSIVIISVKGQIKITLNCKNWANSKK